MKVVYIAGRFRPKKDRTKTVEEQDEEVRVNIHAANLAGMRVAIMGAMPQIPHANTGYAHFVRIGTDRFWLEGTKELMRRAGAVWVFNEEDISGPFPSAGTVGEVEEANRLGIPVFYGEDGLRGLADWIKDGVDDFEGFGVE